MSQAFRIDVIVIDEFTIMIFNKNILFHSTTQSANLFY